jgi:hypothetical protein
MDKISSTHNKHHEARLLLTIEDVMSCPGQCPGCLTSLQDRRTREPSMKPHIMNTLIDRIDAYLDVETGFRSLETIFVIGDHLYLPEEYMQGVYQKFIDRFIDRLPHDDSRFIFSAALYQHYDQVMPILERHMAKSNERFPMQMNCVLDPLNIKARPKLWEEQLKIIRAAKSELGMPVDVSMNLSVQATQSISPKEYRDLVKELGLQEVILNWTPSVNNSVYTNYDLVTIESWIREFTGLLEKDRSITADYIEALRGKAEAIQGLSLNEALEYTIRPLLKHYLYIDYEGNILPRLDGVGDIAHHKAFGYKPTYNVLSHSLKEAAGNLYREVSRQMIKSTTQPACMGCQHKDLCTVSGYHVYTDFLRHTKKMDILKNSPLHQNRCPHVGKAVFDALEL